jgi:arginyl-tRNA synthetase
MKIGKDVEFTVEPTDLSHGDYATNIALVLGKSLKRNPKEVAEEIANKLNTGGHGWLKKAEVAGPGFINLCLTEETLTQAISKEEHIGWNESLKGKKYIVEYTDPNPFKEFHIGHLMSNTIGEAISRLVEASGAETRRACYQGDVGLHVAKAIWWIVKDAEKTTKIRDAIGGEPSEALHDWEDLLQTGKAYAKGNSAYEESNTVKAEIIDINKKLYDKSSPVVNEKYSTVF